MPAQPDVTQLLRHLADGDRDAFDKLWPIIYGELRDMAHRRLQGERRDHTLNTTALVHEAYLKLVNLDRISWQNRAHFFAIAAQAMRNILVNYAVRRKALKRGGGRDRMSLDEVFIMSDARADEILALDEALKRLEQLDERQGRIIDLRFFVGFTIEETADALGISTATVKRDWNMARAWLNRELSSG